ncbi:NUDIX hydrolase [Streptomonospora sp. S1-112]|uniref:NUDIX hydrolase n=1 Tax=Streptomonospora mangrovi TaxID=2883123 RepID=A0A9X3NMV9_9ACTN|nr:NUDIX hydrolase [Streptomonospora mangrovi]MDA0563435.1 NUDIX hydrolase [Streptomonospora mangrovi]
MADHADTKTTTGIGTGQGADAAHAERERAFYDSLPRTRNAAGALLTTGEGRVLLVKPTYKPGWSLPGGVVEQQESPLAACRRECAEELGFVPALRGLVCLDWLPGAGHPDGRPALIHVFAGGVDEAAFARVRLPAEELSAVILAAPAELPDLLPPGRLRRVEAALAAGAAGTTAYLEGGRPVSWG